MGGPTGPPFALVGGAAMLDWVSLIGKLNRNVADTFGREVTWVPAATGAPVTINAIWQTAQQQDAKPMGVYAMAFVVLDDLPAAPVRGDQMIVNGVTYKVYEIEHDNQGGVRLGLRQ